MAVWLSLSGGLLLFLLLYWLVITRIAPKVQVKERMQQFGRLTAATDRTDRLTDETIQTPFSERVLLPFFQQIEQYVVRLAPGQIYAVLAERIARAGRQYLWSVSAFVSFWMLSALLCMIAAVLFAFYANQMRFIQGFAVVLCGLIIGAALPVIFLDSLIAKRQKAILRQLPEVLDLLCISVQAGLSLDGAMSKVTERMDGPLIDEFAKTLRDSRMGMTRRLALNNMAERCGVQEVHLFIGAVVQAERLGVSIGRTLQNQADNMRERRRQSIREQAQKAPVKMLLPLALFIFPALFVVILLPTVFSIINNLKGIAK